MSFTTEPSAPASRPTSQFIALKHTSYPSGATSDRPQATFMLEHENQELCTDVVTSPDEVFWAASRVAMRWQLMAEPLVPECEVIKRDEVHQVSLRRKGEASATPAVRYHCNLLVAVMEAWLDLINRT